MFFLRTQKSRNENKEHNEKRFFSIRLKRNADQHITESTSKARDKIATNRFISNLL